MQKSTAIENKSVEKKSAATIRPQGGESAQTSETTVSDIGVPLFLQRFSASSTPPPVQRSVHEEEEENGKTPVLAKLTIGEPNDPYEKEADQVADRVMQMPESSADTSEEEEPKQDMPIQVQSGGLIQAKRSEKKGPLSINQYLIDGATGGSPLPERTRLRIEPALNADLSHVNVYSDQRFHEVARSIHAKAFTYRDRIFLGQGQSAENVALMAHEATHVVQQMGGDHLLRRFSENVCTETKTPVCEMPNAQSRFETHECELRETILPAIQSAIDRVEETRLLVLGNQLLASWQALKTAYDEMDSPDAVEIVPFDEFLTIQDQFNQIRRLILTQLTLQEFKDNQLLSTSVEPSWEGDIGVYIIQRVHDMAWVLRDTMSLVSILLMPAPIPEANQWEAIGLLRQHQSPWSFAYIQTVVCDRELSDSYDTFAQGPGEYLRQIRAGQNDILAMVAEQETSALIDVASRLGQYQLLPAQSEVRLLQPMAPGEIAQRFYGRADYWDSHLLPYNRGVMQAATQNGLLRAGSVLRLAPAFLSDEFQSIFAYVAQTRRRGGEAYIAMESDEAAVVGNTLRFSLTFEGEVAYSYYNIEWWVENDPIAVEQDHIPARNSGPSGRVYWVSGGDASTAEGTARAAGNHTVFCRFWYENQEPIILSRSFTVMTLEQKTELASHQGFNHFPRDPRRMVEVLQEELDGLPDTQANTERRRELRERINQINESLSDYETPYLHPLEAVYISSEETPRTIPLAISVGRDATYDYSYRGYHLILYDLTQQGPPYIERAEGDRPIGALRNLLREFADNATYPRGNIRFEINSLVLGYTGIPTETVVYPTDGGTLIDDFLRTLSTIALVIGVGAAVLGQAEIAVPALVISGFLAGAAGTFTLIDRLEHGQFEWDAQAALDLMDIAGALVTLGMSRMATASVRGVGRMTLLSQTIDVAQIGIMVGVHYGQIQTAVASGDQQRVYEALFNAARDGALYIIIHRATARLRGRPDTPEMTGAQGQTMAGTARGETPSPTGERPRITAEPDTPEYFRQLHEQQMATLGTRPFTSGPSPAEPSRPVRPETVDTFRPDDFGGAYSSYEQSLATSGGREVGIYRNVSDGTYAVRIGSQHGVSPPLQGHWEAVLHYHPNPDNILTFRMPAPADIESTQLAAFRSGSTVAEFVEHPLPGGGRARTRFSVEPNSGRITIEYTGADGQPIRRRFDSLSDYQRAYFERSFHLDPDSPEYQWVMRDLHDYYRHVPIEGGGGQTMSGIARSGGRSINMPEGATTVQTGRVQSAVGRIRSQGVPMDEPLLELYLHQNRSNLDSAISSIERVSASGTRSDSLLPVGRSSPRGTDVQLSDIFAATPNTTPFAGTPSARPARPYEPRVEVPAEGEPTFAPVAGEDRMDLVRFWDDEIRRVQSDLSEPSWRQYQFRAYRDRVLRGDRPTWRQTEYELQHYYRMMGGERETPFIHGRATDPYTHGSTRPDVTTPRVMLEAKNYQLFEADGTVNRSNLRSLIRTLRHQIGMRAEHGPAGRHQSVILDLRGQPSNRSDIVVISREIAAELRNELSTVLGRPVPFGVENIQVLTW